MDDCSPDDTAAVATSFGDDRVHHIYNTRNLGHLRNYNKGIELARGRYVWLISADDRLRRPYVLERFVAALDAYPKASFVFCPAMKFGEGGETEVYGAHGEQERVFSRPDFLARLLHTNSVCAPAAMARKEHYDRIGGFPLDLPFAGDWYIWARFALDGDVLYLPEPMVGYRIHPLNMTKQFFGAQATALVRDELEVRWRIRQEASVQGNHAGVACLEAVLADDYAYRASSCIRSNSPYSLTLSQVERSIQDHFVSHRLSARLRAAALNAAGDASLQKGDNQAARRAYWGSFTMQPRARNFAKLMLSLLGHPGARLRRAIAGLRRRSVAGPAVSRNGA